MLTEYYMIVTEENGNYVPVRDHEDCPVTADSREEIKTLQDDKYEGCRILFCKLIDEDSTVDPYSAAALAAKYDTEECNWGRHPCFTVDDWGSAAVQEDTLQGYWDWVASMIEYAQEDVDDIPADELPLHINDDDLQLECPEVREYFNKRLSEAGTPGLEPATED